MEAGSLPSRPLIEHCIVQENDQAPTGDEEKEQQQRSQIRKKEESKVLKLKVEKSTLWEEDTEKNLDKSENVSQIFTSDSSNSDSPNDDPIPRQNMILELRNGGGNIEKIAKFSGVVLFELY